MRSAVQLIIITLAWISLPDAFAIKASSSSSYKAAVVEHVPIISHELSVTQQQALQVMNANLDIYEVVNQLVML